MAGYEAIPRTVQPSAERITGFAVGFRQETRRAPPAKTSGSLGPDLDRADVPELDVVDVTGLDVDGGVDAAGHDQFSRA